MKITIDVSDTLIVNALVNAHSRYWCERVVGSTQAAALGGKAAWVVVRDDGGKLPEAGPITASTIATGLGKLATDYPELLGRLCGGDADGPDGDVLLQCIVFGGVIYG